MVKEVLADTVGNRLKAEGCVLMGAALLAHTGNPIEPGSLQPLIELRK